MSDRACPGRHVAACLLLAVLLSTVASASRAAGRPETIAFETCGPMSVEPGLAEPWPGGRAVRPNDPVGPTDKGFGCRFVLAGKPGSGGPVLVEARLTRPTASGGPAAVARWFVPVRRGEPAVAAYALASPGRAEAGVWTLELLVGEDRLASQTFTVQKNAANPAGPVPNSIDKGRPPSPEAASPADPAPSSSAPFRARDAAFPEPAPTGSPIPARPEPEAMAAPSPPAASPVPADAFPEASVPVPETAPSEPTPAPQVVAPAPDAAPPTTAASPSPAQAAVVAAPASVAPVPATPKTVHPAPTPPAPGPAKKDASRPVRPAGPQPAPAVPTAPVSAKAGPAAGSYALQTGLFADLQNAEAQAARLRSRGMPACVAVEGDGAGRRYRVLAGRFGDARGATRAGGEVRAIVGAAPLVYRLEADRLAGLRCH